MENIITNKYIHSAFLQYSSAPRNTNRKRRLWCIFSDNCEKANLNPLKVFTKLLDKHIYVPQIYKTTAN